MNVSVDGGRTTAALRRATDGGGLTLVGLGLAAGLLSYGAVAYPESVQAGGGRDAVAVVAALTVYAAVAVWVRARPAGVTRTVLVHGARIGAALGGVGLLNLTLEHFAGGSPALAAVRGVGMWAALFFGFGAAGSAAVAATGPQTGLPRSLRSAVLASVWSGLVAAVAMVLAGSLLAVAGMPYMTRILAPGFAGSGMADPRAFVVRHTVNAAAMHLLLMPVVAAAFGALGGGAARLLEALPQARARPVRRRAAWSLGSLECALALGGVAALRWAATLPRSARPPFVMTGLLALGLALACAHAVLRAIWSPAPA